MTPANASCKLALLADSNSAPNSAGECWLVAQLSQQLWTAAWTRFCRSDAGKGNRTRAGQVCNRMKLRLKYNKGTQVKVMSEEGADWMMECRCVCVCVTAQ